MAIRDLLWACPFCGTEQGLRPAGRAEVCAHCGTRFRRGHGASIVAERPGEGSETRPAAAWSDRLPPLDVEARIRRAREGGGVLREDRAVLRMAEGDESVYDDGTYLNRIERFGPRREGTLRLELDRLSFVGQTPADTVIWPFEALEAVQASSSTLQLRGRGKPVGSLKFPDGSSRFWEELLCAVLQYRATAEGRGRIVEFQPRIVTEGEREMREHPTVAITSSPGPSALARLATTSALPAGAPSRNPEDRAFYRFCQRLVRTTWPLVGPLDIVGLERVPTSGPFLLISNHQSILDPILIQAICPRPIFTMAKSTQFASPIFSWLLRHLLGFPVRRYQVDAQAVRLALRRLGEGHGVGVYVEGERSWDGRLQQPRLGTLRLILKAGVPVIPCTIQGSYEVWPRWDRRIHRAPVRITFGEPIEFPRPDRRDERERLLPQIGERLMRTLRIQLESPRGH
jgi:1-acyl-sn-glycerol-3-phosphate acyltransferase